MYLKNNKFWVFALLFLLSSFAANAQTRQKVGSNSMTISASAVFEVESNTQGFLPPRMTKLEMNAIKNPVEGLMVYCTTCNVKSIFVYSGTDWLNLVNGLVDISPSSNGTAVVSVYSSKSSAGSMTAGSVVSGVTQTITPTVTTVGTYAITTGAINGVTFAGSGTFPVTGAQDIVLTATGTPTVSGSNNFVLNTSPSVTFSRATLAAGTVASSTGKVWMDRNLGATQVATSSTDASSYGDLYQWGRLADGHQLINRTTSQAVNGPTTTLSPGDVPGNGSFITNSTSPYDWRSTQKDNLWQGVSGTNNPCPTGFRLPTSAELGAEIGAFSSQNASGAFNSVLKLPLAGYRSYSDGSLSDVGSSGLYWSSTVSGTNASLLNFNSSSSGTANMIAYNRAYGFSVRCLKD